MYIFLIIVFSIQQERIFIVVSAVYEVRRLDVTPSTVILARQSHAHSGFKVNFPFECKQFNLLQF